MKKLLLLFVFVPSLAQATLSGWSYKRTLNDVASTNLSNYVSSLTLTSSNFTFSHANTDGSDIRVYDETTASLLPYWIVNYSSVSQTASLYWKATNTTDTQTLYYGNTSTTSIAVFANVFTHGAGFDVGTGFGDLTTAVVSTNAVATHWDASTSLQDPMSYQFTVQQETATLSIADVTALVPQIDTNVYTGVREFNIPLDSDNNNKLLKSGTSYYAFFAIRRNVNTVPIVGFRGTSSLKTGPWTGFINISTPAAGSNVALDYPSCVIKAGNTYYMFLTYGWSIGGSTNPILSAYVSTSTDLTTWGNPMPTINTSLWKDQTSGTANQAGNPWVIKANDGVYFMVVESQNGNVGGSGDWCVAGATSTDLVNWGVVNNGNCLIKDSLNEFDLRGGANPKVLQMPDNSYVITYNGTVGSVDFDWQIGYATSSSRAGPYTSFVNVNPTAGKPVGTYGVETSHFSWDEDNKSFYNVQQRFDTTSATAHSYINTTENNQAGLIMTRKTGAGSLMGVLLDPSATFTAETRETFLSQRTINGDPIAIGLYDGAGVPTPTASGTITGNRRVEIDQETFDRAHPGDVILVYYDSGHVRRTWNGSAWDTNFNYNAREYSREAVATIQDDGTNYVLKVQYADTGALIAGPASIAKASVQTFATGRVLLGGWPFTDAWTGALYYRYMWTRPYSATEPQMATGAEQTNVTTTTIGNATLRNATIR